MAITLTSTGIQYDNSSITSTNTGPATSDFGTPISITSFTTSGTYTVPSNSTKILVQLVGGGGGSAGYCEAGGAGGFSEGVFSVTPGATYSVTIGGGGAGVAYNGQGGAGGTTSFGALISATGGNGANTYMNHGGGHGGLGSGGQLNLYGGTGSGHGNHASHAQPSGGGPSFFGGPGGQYRSATPSNYSPAYGSGATGGYAEHGNAGTAGCGGVCIVIAYK